MAAMRTMAYDDYVPCQAAASLLHLSYPPSVCLHVLTAAATAVRTITVQAPLMRKLALVLYRRCI